MPFATSRPKTICHSICCCGNHSRKHPCDIALQSKSPHEVVLLINKSIKSTFNSLVSGNTGLIPEDTISPAPDLVKSESFAGTVPDTSLLSTTVVLKLNSGLGTGMGLDKAKSLLKVKGNDTFLDLTAKQVVAMREEYKSKVKFMLITRTR